ncbi:MAG: gfo/Idh/MocA family oxidoreductase [Calditrichaeota bacterium]|nr:MAG: gfo/Idh/MocA family oxidoreductase [Calditrichota bacterium]
MSTKDKLRIGIIGAGHIAQVVHIPEWKKIPDVEVSIICDRMQTKAQWVAEKFGIRQYTSNMEDIFKADVDVIDICTPNDTHKDLAVSALSAGKHVLVEKPMARNYQEAVLMRDAAAKYQKHLMVGMNVRFRRDAITLKSFIDGHELGEVFYIKTGWLNRRNLTQAGESWFYQKERSGGGVLMDLGIQMLDVAWWLLGNVEPVAVKAVTFNRSGQLQVEDSATALIHFKNGTAIALETSWTLFSEKDLLYANVHGTEGSAFINPLRLFKNMHGNLINIVSTKEEISTVRYKRSYRNELKHFIDCLRQNTPLQASAEESAERLKILDALYQSAQEGKEVLLS